MPDWERRNGERIPEVEWLLNAVCESFGFPSESRDKFGPDDRLIEIYRNCYPRWKFWRLGDALELESLFLELETRLDLSKIERSTVSFGDIIDRLES